MHHKCPENVIVERGGWDAVNRRKREALNWQKVSKGHTPNASELKTLGNKFFLAKDYVRACDAYGQAIEAGDVDAHVRIVLHSNRAAAFLQRNLFRRAKHDAQRAIDEGAKGKILSKTRFRLAQALDGLGHHRAALEVLALLKKRKAASMVARVRLRYDQSRSSSWYADQNNQVSMRLSGEALDHYADYVGPIEVKSTSDGRGRGLFLTQPVKKSMLLLVEKAFATVLPDLKNISFTADFKTRTVNLSQEQLIPEALARITANPLDNARLAHLCGGSCESVVPALSLLKAGDVPVPTDIPMCSAAEVREIVRKNSFAWEGGRKDHVPVAEKGTELTTGSALYVIASMMNHADATRRSTARIFCGPFIFVFAGRDMEPGEELTTEYFPDEAAKEKSKHWGF